MVAVAGDTVNPPEKCARRFVKKAARASRLCLGVSLNCRSGQPRGLLNRRSLNALLSTKMLDSAMAPAARTGDSKVPVKG